MSENEITFNGPPASKRTGLIAQLKAAIDERPGEWAHVDTGDKTTAASRAQYLRKLGYEATSRLSVVYARKVPS